MTLFDSLSFIGGLALFLFGMNYMGKALENSGGGKFETILEKMTNSRLKGVLFGAGITAAVQSSSAVTVMAVGFVNSGIMQLKQVVGIIMGANIGTTITSWILSLTGIESTNVFVNFLKPANFSAVLAIVGIGFMMFSKKDKLKNIGSILIGFTVLIYGMEMMTDSVENLKDVPQFSDMLVMFSNPLLGIFTGAVLTSILQSSSASVGILQALTAAGNISFAMAFPIVLGQNIGTCVTALLSALGANRNAKRAAALHLLFNLLGVFAAVVIFYGGNVLLDFDFYDSILSVTDIAMIHSVFNVFSTIILFPFATQLEKTVRLMIPDKKENDNNTLINEKYLMSAEYAIEKVKEKCNDMGIIAQKNIELCLDLLNDYSVEKSEMVLKNENILDELEDRLETYLIKTGNMNLNFSDGIEISKLNHAIGNFERIGDYGVNILKTKQSMVKNNYKFSDEANQELKVMANAVNEIMLNSVYAFINEDTSLACSVEPLEQVIDDLKKQLKSRHIKRLQNNKCSTENDLIFFDIVNSFERIADHCSNLSLCVIELSQGSYCTHSYLKTVKTDSNGEFKKMLKNYSAKYKI